LGWDYLDRTIAVGLFEAEEIVIKTWTVVQNTGKRADLESGTDRKEINRPENISARDFIRWLAPNSRLEDGVLQSLFKK
jgi:hypothetical protein